MLRFSDHKVPLLIQHAMMTEPMPLLVKTEAMPLLDAIPMVVLHEKGWFMKANHVSRM